MQCDFCTPEPHCVYAVPVANGHGWPSFACRDCARKLGVFCDRHACQHAGWPGTTSFCSACMDETVEAHAADVEMVKALFLALPKKELRRLEQEAQNISFRPVPSVLDIRVLRLIFVLAHQRQCTPQDVIAEAVRQRSAASLLLVPS